MTPHDLAHELEKTYGSELKAVVLYGETASRDPSSPASTGAQLFCVLENPVPTVLARANKTLRRFTSKGHPAPLFFSPTHIERSLDVFPIEFLDMIARHTVLLGTDPLAGISVDPRNLRHQCESELKGKILHLRSLYALECHRPRHIGKLLLMSLPTFIAAFRAALQLADKAVPTSDREVIELAAVTLRFQAEPFIAVHEVHLGHGCLPRGNEALALFERYLHEIEQLSDAIDQLHVG